ncbi:hypothetical protein TNCV_2500421 [Trichonephila clavipes]|nr:hypothetical protein TNCV_2500421 [Trichonephila clavipes]
MGFHNIRQMISPNIDPRYYDKQRKGFAELPLPHLHPVLAWLIPRFANDRAYPGSLRMASWTSNEFGRIRGAFTTTVGRNVTDQHTGPICLNAQPQ